ncbi:MAG: TIGR04283 family arsenosugar biosynthesis glycosyltransferase [Rhodocyclaceae bacterium]|nr:TIGR04283 family arsenosugar biosynthesis glycosyltransferase [Rhodocyclaceae bacterium]
MPGAAADMQSDARQLSIIVPVLDEAAGIADSLRALAALRAAGAEIVVVDGGSRDATCACAAPHADRVVAAPRGRGAQLHAGAKLARGEVLLFLHADTRLPPDAWPAMQAALAGGQAWGRFDVHMEGGGWVLALVARMMNARSRLSGIATGDQAIFARRDFYLRTGGFPDIALMEDIAFSAAARRLERPACLAARVSASPRRWQKHGVLATVLLMWRLRAAYFFGADPQALALAYGYTPRGRDGEH